MLDILLWVGIFIASLAVLIKASDYFTVSAEKIGLFFNLPTFIIGVTIVAFGTSLPELGAAIFAVMKGASEIVVGTVVGSNIANICLVLGVASIISKKMKVSYELIHVDLPLLVGSAFFLYLTIMDGQFTLVEGILCLVGLAIYLTYTVKSEAEGKDKEIEEETKGEFVKNKKFDYVTLLICVVSAAFIYFGAKYTVMSVIKLGDLLSIGTEIIAISAIALGTSLPELAVTINAAKKGKPEIAVGNVLGSNIFNSFAVMGVPAFFGTLSVPSNIITFGVPVMISATLLYFFVTQDKEITNWEGSMLLLFYVFFIGKLFRLF